MTVRIGRMTFSDWVSLPFEDGWTDTFIFRIDTRACIPPFDYAPLLNRMAAHTLSKRSSASLWVQVEGPGEWFAAELRRSLRGLRLPFAVTCAGADPAYLDFSRAPALLYSRSQPPPVVADRPPSVSHAELRCLQALARMRAGDGSEVASLAGLSDEVTEGLLRNLEQKKWVECTSNEDRCLVWHARSKGLSAALRSWGVPTGVEFTAREEENLQDVGSGHRRLARLWPAWLKSAWPRAEVWAGWSEVGLPGASVIPDALAWGRIQGYETLFWLEVGDGHKSRAEITQVTRKRLEQARKLCARSGVRLVYTQLSTPWVHESARWACVQLADEVAVVLGNWRRFGELPVLEWGRVISNILN
ncbi:MAG: hypothetical protein HY869_09140 [Chloroflexi bacterium]|nr:hypothetical protein [Chloroflexota bacterium]